MIPIIRSLKSKIDTNNYNSEEYNRSQFLDLYIQFDWFACVNFNSVYILHVV